MASIPELLNGHVRLEVECLDRLYLDGYIGSLATAGGLVYFMREQLGKPIPSPVVLGQITERYREDVKAMAERERIPIHAFNHKERKDDVANHIRKQRGTRDGAKILCTPGPVKPITCRRILRTLESIRGPRTATSSALALPPMLLGVCIIQVPTCRRNVRLIWTAVVMS